MGVQGDGESKEGGAQRAQKGDTIGRKGYNHVNGEKVLTRLRRGPFLNTTSHPYLPACVLAH